MNCARCQSVMLRYDVPRPDGSSAWIDRCNACGLWYDHDELPALHPSFTNDAVREALYSAPRVTVDPRLRIECPGCVARPALAAVSFVGVVLDVCERCRGVWVDRDEYATLMHALLTHATGLAPAPAAHYRAPPAAATMTRKAEQWSRCVECNVEVPFAEVFFTERGFMCFACGSQHQRAE